jgi:hypothetical protein
MQINDWLAPGCYQEDWQQELMEGYVTSADTGAEDLVRASRAALAQFCEAGNTELVYRTLILILSRNLSSVNNNDRVIVPCLEVISFLFDARILQKTLSEYNYPSPSPFQHSLTFFSWSFLFTLVQKAHYKTGNVRKLEASIKVYGGLYEVYPRALGKLTTMILHPFPKIRNLVAEELWVIKGVGKGVKWATAKREDMLKLTKEMGLQIPKVVEKP